MDENLNQTITFLGSGSKMNEKNFDHYLNSAETLLNEIDTSTHRFLLDKELNMERTTLSMLKFCGKECINNFKIEKITKTEEDCLLSCHFKYLNIVKSGVGVMNGYLKFKEIN